MIGIGGKASNHNYYRTNSEFWFPCPVVSTLPPLVAQTLSDRYGRVARVALPQRFTQIAAATVDQSASGRFVAIC